MPPDVIGGILAKKMTIMVATVAAALGVLGFSTTSTDASSPGIRISDVQPLTIVGAHYRPGAHVRVTASTRIIVSKVVTADTRGYFRVVFASVRVGRCTAATRVVAQSDGTRSVIKRLPAPDCPPPE